MELLKSVIKSSLNFIKNYEASLKEQEEDINLNQVYLTNSLKSYNEKNLNNQETIENVLKLMFHHRDVTRFGGNACSADFLLNYTLMWRNGSQNLKNNLLYNIHLIPKYGRWKDLIQLYQLITDQEFRDEVLDYFEEQLNEDLCEMCKSKSVSMCAKYIPTEGHTVDKRCHFYSHLAKYMQITKKQLRTRYITPLRQYIGHNSMVFQKQNLNNKLLISKLYDQFIETSRFYFDSSLNNNGNNNQNQEMNLTIEMNYNKFKNMIMNKIFSSNEHLNYIVVFDVQHYNFCLASLLAILLTDTNTTGFGSIVKNGEFVHLSEANNSEMTSFNKKFNLLLNTQPSNPNELLQSVKLAATYNEIYNSNVIVITDRDVSRFINENFNTDDIFILNVNQARFNVNEYLNMDKHHTICFNGFNEITLDLILNNKELCVDSVVDYILTSPRYDTLTKVTQYTKSAREY